MNKSALVLFAEGSEELEAVSIVDILRRGGVNVVLAGLTGGPLRGSRGTVLLPDTTLDEAATHAFDMIVLPGGQPGTRHLREDARVLSLLRQMHMAGKYVAAICAAPSVLATAGLLENRKATSFPACLDGFPGIQLDPAAVVEDGRLITSRGPGTAMDFSLLLLERLCGKAKRDEVEAGLVR